MKEKYNERKKARRKKERERSMQKEPNERVKKMKAYWKERA